VAFAAARSEELRTGLEDVRALLDKPRKPAEVRARLGSSSDARESVSAAIYSALAQPTFQEAIRFAVRLGGDTDTVAAMSGAISGARHGANSIPRRWLDSLEEGDRGRSHVEQLAARLAPPAHNGNREPIARPDRGSSYSRNPRPSHAPFPFDRAPDAHRFIAERRNIGKVVLVP